MRHPVQRLVQRQVLAAVVALMIAGGVTRSDALPQPAHKAFVLIEYQVRDKPLFLKLRDKVRASLKSYRGDVVTRDKVEPLFGGSPTNLSVVSFPTIEDARAWLASKALAEIKPEREKAAQVSTYLVEKLD